MIENEKKTQKKKKQIKGLHRFAFIALIFEDEQARVSNAEVIPAVLQTTICAGAQFVAFSHGLQHIFAVLHWREREFSVNVGVLLVCRQLSVPSAPRLARKSSIIFHSGKVRSSTSQLPGIHLVRRNRLLITQLR